MRTSRLALIAAICGFAFGLLSDGGWAALTGGDGIADADEIYEKARDAVIPDRQIRRTQGTILERNARLESIGEDEG